MKEIMSYSNYSVVKEWKNDEIEKELNEIELERFRKFNGTCLECGKSLSIIITNGLIGSGRILICTYCHTEYDITDYDCW